MIRIIDIGQFFPRVGPTPSTPALKSAPSPARGDVADIVEISPFARLLFRVHNRSSLSDAKTAAIRSEIDGGRFETPERLNGTVDRLLDVIG